MPRVSKAGREGREGWEGEGEGAYELFTAMFSHQSFTHLLVKCVTLYSFGAEGKDGREGKEGGEGGRSGSLMRMYHFLGFCFFSPRSLIYFLFPFFPLSLPLCHSRRPPGSAALPQSLLCGWPRVFPRLHRLALCGTEVSTLPPSPSSFPPFLPPSPA